MAENTADELARSDGREVQLEEDPDLQLPFLLPEDGYSCDVVRNLPNGLQDFLEPLLQRGGLPHLWRPVRCLQRLTCCLSCDRFLPAGSSPALSWHVDRPL